MVVLVVAFVVVEVVVVAGHWQFVSVEENVGHKICPGQYCPAAQQVPVVHRTHFCTVPVLVVSPALVVVVSAALAVVVLGACVVVLVVVGHWQFVSPN